MRCRRPAQRLPRTGVVAGVDVGAHSRGMRAAQRYDDAVITGLAHVDAPHVVTSTELEGRLTETLKRLRITPGLLERLSGIAERRVWGGGAPPSAGAPEAGGR